MKGLVHIYTGNGKGKTTAAIGLGIRAAGNGFKVLMVQFMKSFQTGEIDVIKRLEPDFVLKRGTSINKFTWKMTDEEKRLLAKEQEELLKFVRNELASGKWQLVILDEIIGALGCGLVSEAQTCDIILNKPENVELVLTGRNASDELVRLADYVSEINEKKHPAKTGIKARKGIEY
jgi:cob(I)alamin adenosyltransferase